MIRIRTVFSGVLGTPYYSNMYFGDSTPPNTAVSLVAGFWSACASQIVTALSWTVDGVVPTMDPITGDITGSTSVTGSNGAGTSAGELLPRANQALVRWRTGAYINGREVRGRTFIPGLNIIADDAGSLLASTQLQFTNAGNALIAGGGQMLCWSKTHGETRVVTAATTWNQFASLRSRRD